ncbi:hypothetical protein [Streptomyces sp. NBC_01012]|uniref:hypothetical protein n=1 Tax=Streptomyces sp. NBC_01012 TaxID=2903717 RepID=UPI00386EFF74|nr:hypothetical protein OG623_10940 [Streptomyces sp. NBC_01012]
MDEETHHPAKPVADRLVCARCGTTATSDPPPPTWLCSVENGSRQYFCEDCARTHIRAIESRLDSAWW